MEQTYKSRIIFCISFFCFALVNPVYAQLDDPTLPPNFSNVITQKESGAKTWILSSILISSQRRVAIINGQMVKVGDMLDGAKVKSINNKGAKLIYREEVVELNLHATAVKKIRKETQN